MIGLLRPVLPSGHESMAGFSLIELLVAATCTGLIAAGVLSLMVGSARASRQLLAQTEIRALARAATLSIAADLERVGRGTEGARSITEHGKEHAMIAPVPGGLIRVLVPAAPAIEVEALGGAGRYRAASLQGLVRVGLVAGLGIGMAPVPLPVARLRSVTSARRGPAPRMGVVEVGWAAAEAELIARAGGTRALLPLIWREYRLVRQGETLQLRRRDDGGRWQPVVDGLLAVRIDFLVDHDGDARPDGGLVASPDPAAAIVGARIRASAVLGDWSPVAVERWVRVGT